MAKAGRSGRSNSGVGAQGRSRRAKLAAQRAAEAKRRRERRIVIGVALGLAIVLVVGGVVALIVRSNSTQTTEQWPITEVQQTPVNGEPIHFGTGGDNSSGDKHVEMFIDFHCPHCVTFEQRFGSILQEAESKGIATIDIYPMAFIDQGSVNAANAFACAAEAGYPRAYFNALFANATRQWSQQQLVDLAEEIGQDPSPEFEQCVNDQQYASWVESISGAADQRGVTGTPTIFIDGQLVDFSSLDEDSLRAQLGL